MLEGGNHQLHDFFARHALGSGGKNGVANLQKRYVTKAAQFYRDGIEQHASRVRSSGVYRGREASRKLLPLPPRSNNGGGGCCRVTHQPVARQQQQPQEQPRAQEQRS